MWHKQSHDVYSASTRAHTHSHVHTCLCVLNHTRTHIHISTHTYPPTHPPTQDLNCKVGDFGLSRLTQPPSATAEQKQSHLRALNPRWLPPEVLTGDAEVTAATDVYAFGIILWEVATMLEPFESMSLEQVLCAVAIRKETPPLVPPEELLGGGFVLLERYYALMEACWRQEPSERPGFGSVMATLQEIADELKVLSKPSFAEASVVSAKRVVEPPTQQPSPFAAATGALLAGVRSLWIESPTIQRVFREYSESHILCGVRALLCATMYHVLLHMKSTHTTTSTQTLKTTTTYHTLTYCYNSSILIYQCSSTCPRCQCLGACRPGVAPPPPAHHPVSGRGCLCQQPSRPLCFTQREPRHVITCCGSF